MGQTDVTAAGDVGVARRGDETGPHGALGLLEHASKVAEDTLNKAYSEAEGLLRAAREEAQEVLRSAREQAEAVRRSVKEEAEAVRRSVKEEAQRERATAAREAEQRRQQAVDQADLLLGQARQQVAELEEAAVRLRSERDAAAQSTLELAARLNRAASGQEARPESQQEKSPPRR